MNIRGCVSTDAGKKTTGCTDAVVLKIAASGRYGRIAFAVLCDGAEVSVEGGKASTMVAERFAAWFHDELPRILEKSEADMRKQQQGRASARVLTEVLRAEDLRRSYSREMFELAQVRIRKRLREITGELNVRISGYRRLHGRSAGCITSCVLLMGGEYMLMHVGPSRAYLVHPDRLFLLQHEADEPEEKTSPFGTEQNANPVFLRGALPHDTGILLCSDAFVRRQEPGRFLKTITRCIRMSEKRQATQLKSLTKYVRRRGEEHDAFAVFLSCAKAAGC